MQIYEYNKSVFVGRRYGNGSNNLEIKELNWPNIATGAMRSELVARSSCGSSPTR